MVNAFNELKIQEAKTEKTTVVQIMCVLLVAKYV